MKKPSKEAIGRACLIAYAILLLPSPLLLGDPTGWWLTIAFALIPAIILGSQKQRILAGIFVAFTLVVAIAYARDTGSVRLRSRLIQCERELADLKAKQEEGPMQ